MCLMRSWFIFKENTELLRSSCKATDFYRQLVAQWLWARGDLNIYYNKILFFFVVVVTLCSEPAVSVFIRNAGVYT